MPNLTPPSKSTQFKIFLAVLFLAIGGAVGTFTYLGFVELQQLNESITDDRDRLALLESAPTPTPQHTPTLQPAPTPPPTPTAQPTTTPQPAPTPITLPPTVTPISLPPSPTPVPTWNDLYTQIRRSVVKVETSGGSGTGWVYEEGWLVTAAHVVKGYRTVTVHYQDSEGEEQSAMVNVLGRDRLHDIAAVELKDIDLPAIPGRRDVEAKDGGEAL